MANPIRILLVRALRETGSLALGGTILGLVAHHCGPQEGVADIHVSTPGTDVTVDDAEYHVATLWETPIVCDLSPGPHLLRMCRGGRVVFEQEFWLAPGQEVVLSDWEGPGGR
ncbi:MAG TPA: hypothetical protein VFF52_09195 [Isosphaeraceae bacterium]|nr:hypothetical protein [Isosphaeraceae bacterium]